MNEQLRNEILHLLSKDQEEIAELEAYKSKHPQFVAELEERLKKMGKGARMFSPIVSLEAWVSEGTAPEIVQQHVTQERRRFDRLCEIVHEFGWPGRTLVGDDCAIGAAALLAHADSEDVRRRALCQRMREAVLQGEIGPRPFAHIVDRMAIIRGEEQEYGTLMGILEAERADFWWPVRDRDHLDARRREIGLPPVEEDLQQFADAAKHGPFLAPLRTDLEESHWGVHK